VSGTPGAIHRLDSLQLGGNGRTVPAQTITTPSAGFGSISPLAFDDNGMMWVTSPDDNLLLGFDPEALGTPGHHNATVIISAHDSSLNLPTGLAFDRSGALWVTNFGNGTIIRFDAAQLRQSGSPAPAVVLSGLGHPFGIAFDRVGGLWYGERLANTINRLTFGELARSGTPMPTVTLRDTLGSIDVPGGIAIDSAGSIWVANAQNSTVVAFAFDQTLSSGAKIPHVTLQSAGPGSFFVPGGLAFDSSGNLWVMNIGGSVQKLGRDQLRGSSTPTPAVSLQLSGAVLFNGMAFYPKPGFGPLN
jgi:sugar lactone lactonase YvrE